MLLLSVGVNVLIYVKAMNDEEHPEDPEYWLWLSPESMRNHRALVAIGSALLAVKCLFSLVVLGEDFAFYKGHYSTQ